MKKAEREYIDYLRDILSAIEKAESFVEGMEFEAFEAILPKCREANCFRLI